MSDSVVVEKRATYAIVTLNRPEKLNALNSAMVQLLHDTMQEIAGDASIRAIILTGSGAKAFVAGADIAEIADLDSAGGQRFAEAGQRVFRAIETLAKPVIAAINGFALGGGCELALSCHLRIAADNARFGLPEITLGLIPGYGGTQRLPRLIGRSTALQMMLTGEMINAERALQCGLVSEVVAADSLMERAEEIAGNIARQAPIAASLILDAVYRGGETDLDSSLTIEGKNFGRVCQTEDMRSGTAAFLARTKPQFKGK